MNQINKEGDSEEIKLLKELKKEIEALKSKSEQ
jgi:hypothetical protein